MDKRRQRVRVAEEDGPDFGDDTRITQRVPVQAKERFVAAREHKCPINEHFGIGKQLAAAMFVWDEFLPEQMQIAATMWALGLWPYDPAIGKQIRETLRQSLPQASGQSAPPDKPDDAE